MLAKVVSPSLCGEYFRGAGGSRHQQWLPFLRKNAGYGTIVKQQYAQCENQIIEERIVGGRDNYHLPSRCDKKTGDPPTTGKKHHPDQTKFERERCHYRGGMEPVRQVLHVPANPRG